MLSWVTLLTMMSNLVTLLLQFVCLVQLVEIMFLWSERDECSHFDGGNGSCVLCKMRRKLTIVRNKKRLVLVVSKNV